ncbi:MAG: hypothetical protein P8Y36_12390 [Alphaproteobacteria bacterium]
MKKILTVAAVVALAGMTVASAPRDAKADGGAVAIGVAAYLAVDALVGHECRIHSWPFNLVTKLGDELHGRRGCHPRRYHPRRRHRRANFCLRQAVTDLKAVRANHPGSLFFS